MENSSQKQGRISVRNGKTGGLAQYNQPHGKAHNLNPSAHFKRKETIFTKSSKNPNTVQSDRTDVLVTNVPANATAVDIEELFADAGPVRRVALKRNGRAIIHFVLATDAQRTVAEMDGRELHDHTLKLSFFSEDEPAAVVARHDPVNPRLFRLIVRNLPFGVKEAAVRGVFQDFGRLLEVHLPTKPGPDGPTGRGFGFLQFSSKKEAKEAVDRGNGMEVLGRPVAVDWALGKEFYAAAAPAPTPPATPAAAARPRPASAAAAAPSEGGAGSQRKRKAAAAAEKEASGGGGDEEGEAAEEGGKGEKKTKKKRGAEVEATGGGGAQRKDNAEGGAVPQGEETAVFVRNVPLDATDDDLSEARGGGTRMERNGRQGGGLGRERAGTSYACPHPRRAMPVHPPRPPSLATASVHR
jgi:nucleolar protein 4